MPPEQLATAVAAAAVDKQRWFGGKGGRIDNVRLVGSVGPFEDEWLLAVSVAMHDRADELYILPALLEDGLLADARGPVFVALLQACLDDATLSGERLRLDGAAGPAPRIPQTGTVRPLGVDQSNTTLVIGERVTLKCYRRFDEGPHPEIEVTRHLSKRGLECLPAVRGSADVVIEGRRGGALLVQDYVADGRDGWLAAEAELGTLLGHEDVDAAAHAPDAWAPQLGSATADLHALLATADEEGFRPRSATRKECDRLYGAACEQLAEALRIVPADVRAELARAKPLLRTRFAGFRDRGPFLLTRVHGDLHLGQFLLRDGRPPALVDFEGEPTKPVGERRRRASPLRDLAGLLRSIDHAAQWVLRAHVGSDDPVAARVADAWTASARTAIQTSYERRLEERGALFAVDDEILAAFEAEKAVYEFVYAVRFLPSWLDVPRRALTSALA